MTNNFKVGLVALIIASFAGAFVFWQNNIVQQFSGYDVKVRFDNIGSLIIGAEIRYRGFKVGRVTEIFPEPTHVDVLFWVQGDLKITKGSTRCGSCASKKFNKRKVKNRPSLETLLEDLKTLPYTKVGKKYGVSDNCIRKWIKQYQKNK